MSPVSSELQLKRDGIPRRTCKLDRIVSMMVVSHARLNDKGRLLESEHKYQLVGIYRCRCGPWILASITILFVGKQYALPRTGRFSSVIWYALCKYFGRNCRCDGHAGLQMYCLVLCMISPCYSARIGGNGRSGGGVMAEDSWRDF